MFTGLIEEVGKVLRVSGLGDNRVLRIAASFAKQLKRGDSVAVDGCCLTVVKATGQSFEAEAVAATLKNTTLGSLKAGSRVNLERALTVGQRLGGHFVQGHVDEVLQVRKVERRSGYWEISLQLTSRGARFLVDRGSVCVNGVSLTVSLVTQTCFHVNVIPYTWENTNLKELRGGSKVNVEYDFLIKAVAGMISRAEKLTERPGSHRIPYEFETSA